MAKLFIESDIACLMSEWHSTKNTKKSSKLLSWDNEYKAWWRCANKHEWQATIRQRRKNKQCPYCEGRMVMATNNFAVNHPELVIEWHEKNPKKPEEYSTDSQALVWWKCKECSHEWRAAPHKRHMGRLGCSQCGLKKKNLAIKMPHLVKFWDEQKNKQSVYEVLPNSKQEAWWKCPDCNYEWRQKISNRSEGGGNCPECVKNIRLQRTLLACCPDKAAELCDSVDPAKISAASEKVVGWKCSVCGYKWKQAIHRRVQDRAGLCLSCNSVAAIYPDLAKEWSKKNKKRASEVYAHSGDRYYWECRYCLQTYKKSIGKKVAQPLSGCRRCNSATSFPEQAVFYYIKSVFPDAKNGARLLGKIIDIFIPSLNVCVEYDGRQYHKDAHKDLDKNILLQKNGYRVIRLREKGCAYIFALGCDIIEIKERRDYSCLDGAIRRVFRLLGKRSPSVNISRDIAKIAKGHNVRVKQKSIGKDAWLMARYNHKKNIGIDPYTIVKSMRIKLWWICEKCGCDWEAYPRDLLIAKKRDRNGCHGCVGRIVTDKNNLLVCEPEFVKNYWDYTKNLVKPEDVTFSNTTQVIYWKCNKCGNEWCGSVDRNRKLTEPCEKCRAIKPEESLAILNPEMLQWWDKGKNELSPFDVTPAAKKKVWWHCLKCGYSWEITIQRMVNLLEKCPACAGRKVHKNNTLVDTHPNLVKDWDYVKNKISPGDITHKYQKRVYWKCNICENEWTRTVAERVAHNSGCPRCVRVDPSNYLLLLHPTLQAVWDKEKNGALTEGISVNSKKKVFWKCIVCGESYQQIIRDRVGVVKGMCSQCKAQKRNNQR